MDDEKRRELLNLVLNATLNALSATSPVPLSFGQYAELLRDNPNKKAVAQAAISIAIADVLASSAVLGGIAGVSVLPMATLVSRLLTRDETAIDALGDPTVVAKIQEIKNRLSFRDSRTEQVLESDKVVVDEAVKWASTQPVSIRNAFLALLISILGAASYDLAKHAMTKSNISVPPASANEIRPNAVTTGDGLRVRETPSETGTILALLPESTLLVTGSEQGDWVKVRTAADPTSNYHDVVGWVHRSYILKFE